MIDKKQMKNILQRDNHKRDKKIQRKHISHCSFKWDIEKKSGVGWGGGGAGRRRKNSLYIFIAEEGKQYQNNGTENIFVDIIYLIEAFKMRLLSIAESFESPKRSNSTFR